MDRQGSTLECVVNISEGRRLDVVEAIAAEAGDDLLDVHSDPHHHRSVLTLVGEAAPRAVTRSAVARLDLRDHAGVHPRLGVVDVVPFVPLGDVPLADAVAARDRFARWAAESLGLPCFVYGDGLADDVPTLPEVRRSAWTTRQPDVGPAEAHPSAGACCVGARPVLVAYNIWLADPDLATARRVAAEIRGPHLRTLGLAVGDRVQVSTNLVAPHLLGPADAYDRVRERVAVAGAELVGLLPSSVLSAVPEERWDELDLDPARTIEHRLAMGRPA